MEWTDGLKESRKNEVKTSTISLTSSQMCEIQSANKALRTYSSNICNFGEISTISISYTKWMLTSECWLHQNKMPTLKHSRQNHEIHSYSRVRTFTIESIKYIWMVYVYDEMTRQKRYTLCVIYDQLHGQFHSKHSSTHVNDFLLVAKAAPCNGSNRWREKIVSMSALKACPVCKGVCVRCMHFPYTSDLSIESNRTEPNQFGSIKWRKRHKSYEHLRNCDCFDFRKYDGKLSVVECVFHLPIRFRLLICALSLFFSLSFANEK